MKTIQRAIIFGLFGGLCFAASTVSAYTLINWTSQMSTDMFSWIGNLFTDLSPILVIVIPVMLVATVISLILTRIGGSGK